MISTTIDALDRDIALILEEELSPKARSATLAAFARETIDEAASINRAALGEAAPLETFVDGVRSNSFDQVRPDGVIVAEFDLTRNLLAWIAEQLELHSPVGSGTDTHPGLYKRSHKLLADGAEVEARKAPAGAREYVFVSAVPYARRIERGWSRQDPGGVYQVVAVLAARRFAGVARVSFEFRAEPGIDAGGRDARQPVIVVAP